jgi:uncharacterized protein HemX
VLDSLVSKAKKTKSSVWKWILGVCIAVIVVFAAWMLKRKYDELVRLRAEKRLDAERQKDMELRAKTEENKNLAKAFSEEADRLNTRVKERETDIMAKEREYVEAKKRIDDAKDWHALEKEAKGDES